MADALVSALASTIVANLNYLLLGEFTTAGSLRTELQNLESTFTTIQAVLCDAEEKQWENEAVKNWLRKLKVAAYEADDILDEFAIEAERRRLQKDLKNRVRSFFSLQNPLVFRVKMAHKLRSIREKLDAIAYEKDQFHLTRVDAGDREVGRLDWRETTSLVNESEILGRDEEKEKLINMVLSNSDDCSVFAICGMGGLGKTTLAQLVYNDRSIDNHFDLRIWTCVSDDFEMRRLVRAMIESIQGIPCNNQELDPLQRGLQEKLGGRKFLLVLDDVWNENPDKWDGLKNALRCGAKGSAVIITTRIEKVALMMATVPIHYMGRLSDDDSWFLFEQRAFGLGMREEFVHLETIGRAIVKKCGGVPLAIKAMGSLMRFKRNESEWLSVKESEIWDLSDEGKTILPAIKLSYDHLPQHWRQCFSFCSICPKDYIMKKEQLIELWMANGFIAYRGPMDLHDLGNEIFKELVWRSFLQDINEDLEGKITCKMHDLVHDLAQSIMKYECCLIETDKALEVSEEIRHLAIYDKRWNTFAGSKDLHKVQSLRSFLMLCHDGWRDVHPCFSKQKNLRALFLRDLLNWKWPRSISNLKHLRYLDVSYSPIKTLPESFTSLQKLQTLNLTCCHALLTLPKGTRHMKNLICLRIIECNSLSCIPAGIGQLTCLRKLSMFIVGENNGHYIGELKGLDLVGDLKIKNLENIKNLADAKSADLMLKKNLKSLELIWSADNGRNNSKEKIEEALFGLQPHSNLKKLRIEGYGGSKFPNWMMDLLLPNLVEIKLECCGKCEHLPPFGKLQFLKVLELKGMDAIKCIDIDMYGDEESSFPSLERLSISSMGSLEKLATMDGTNIFTRLGELDVSSCPMLVELPIIPSVKILKVIGGSQTLLRSTGNLTFLTSLVISNFPEVTHLPIGSLQNQSLLEFLVISGFPNLESLSNEFDNLTALRHLHLERCYRLETLPEGFWSLNALESLRIWNCHSICCNFSSSSSLRSLDIQNCRKFATLSEGMQYLTSLECLLLNGCPEMSSLPESVKHLISLQSLSICHWVGLTCLPNEIEHLISLSHLSITSCPNLFYLPEGIRSLENLTCLLIASCPNLMCLPEGIRSLMNMTELLIEDCPHLEKRCKKERGEDWPKIAHIPNIKIINWKQKKNQCWL